MPAVRCILCGKGLTKGEMSALDDADRFVKVLSLCDKILLQEDRPLNSYIGHASAAQPVLARGNGWHQVPCFSHTEYLKSRIRTIGVLNGKLYWDDFHHADSICDHDHRLLSPGEINHLLGIVPGKRKRISTARRRLVLEKHGGKCARWRIFP